MSRDDLLSLASRYADTPGTTLLYSGGDFETSNQSFLCLYPIETISFSITEEDPWTQLKSLLHFENQCSFPRWIGYLTYEMGARADVPLPYSTNSIPDVFFQRFAIVLAIDHSKDKATLIHQQATSSIIHPFDSQEIYFRKIEEAKEHILSGDIYQVNLSQQMTVQTEHDPFTCFSNLVRQNPAPFCAYINGPDFSIISSSPERLLCKKGSRLETRPIKGTAPRGKTPEEDTANLHHLQNSPKEKSELLMITDLMRNDLGKISQPGSVQVDAIWKVEAYTNVFHMLSVIHSQALDLHPLELLKACFPGGSITGCPKLSSMEIIHKLEQRPRGIYTGSIGYFTDDGDFDFNIAIRTFVHQNKKINIQLGGAIVFDSVPEQEYQETLHKGASIFKALDLTI